VVACSGIDDIVEGLFVVAVDVGDEGEFFFGCDLILDKIVPYIFDGHF